MADPITRALFSALVARLGGVDAAAAVLEARFGIGHKGTVSKMCAGIIGVTVDAAGAVEDAVGDYPISRRMFARQEGGFISAGAISELTALSAASAGMAHSQLVRALSHASEGGEQVTQREARDVIAEMTALRDLSARIVAELEVVIEGGA